MNEPLGGQAQDPLDGFVPITVTTIGDMLLGAARRWPDHVCVIVDARRITYRELAMAAIGRARSLIALGVRPGEHVALLLPTCMELAEILFGVALIGAVPVPLNARYRGAELRYLVGNSDAVCVVTTGAIAEGVNLVARLLEGIGPAPFDGLDRLRDVVCLADAPPGTMEADAFAQAGATVDTAEVMARRAQVRVRDTGLILYTSGTTSAPKGCLLSHEALVRNAAALAARYGMTEQDRFWSPLPMYHIGAIMPLAAVLQTGGRYVTMRHFSAGPALRMLQDEAVTVNYLSFATFLSELMNHTDYETVDLSRMRLINSNLSVQPDWLREALAQRLPDTIQLSTYGMSESAGAFSTSRPDDSYEARMTRLGGPLAGLQVCIRDEAGNPLPTGARGEITLRGYSLLDGYYKDPGKTAQALRDGWFYTGDIGSLDAAGHLMFHGRTKEMLKVGGENVSALEVEAFIGNHPAVKLCQVVGIPDQRLVEVPAAFIELKPGQTATEAEIIAFCRDRIASFKVPRHVRFVVEWPIGASKIQKFKLVDQLVAELAAPALQAASA